MTPGNTVALLGTMLVLAIVPGPSDIAVVARSVASGFTSALFMIVGIVAADLVFIVLAVYSLTAIAELMGGHPHVDRHRRRGRGEARLCLRGGASDVVLRELHG
ncbi:LysE family transporter [Sorangium sp. So ce341]|uniref:LysE family transporter n=1 Tax=Sorangium sp. So ce341 TaxID=3133302 RepID=UPI003F636412